MSPDINGKKPIGYRVKEKYGDRSSKLRNAPGRFVKEKLPDPPGVNLTDTTVAGATGAGVATILEDVIGAPFGASVDVVNVEPADVGDLYTVNVNAPTRNMAEARAFMDSTTGFISYLTDMYEVKDIELLNRRPLRDTYQIELYVRK